MSVNARRDLPALKNFTFEASIMSVLSHVSRLRPGLFATQLFMANYAV
jgi:hypothetical protein